MESFKSKILFDKQDYELLDIVNDVLGTDKKDRRRKLLFDPYLHPNGIKELAAPRELRVAYAMINLLDSLEVGRTEDRLIALRSVRDEVLHCSGAGFRYNTGRVLLQIMKDLVRAHGDELRQLTLAHDFRKATSGKHRIIRKLLNRYHLLEMPETWNQITFDDHVHDANTKGRKSSTHLIMDAWIKGIRELTIIHYNHVTAEAASELLEAAEIMGISVRIGLEFSACFHNQYINLIWMPKGFAGSKDYLEFLNDPTIRSLMAEGRKVSDLRQEYVLRILNEFNETHAKDIQDVFDIKPPHLNPAEFLTFVGSGQASLLHLARFVEDKLKPLIVERLIALQGEYEAASAEQKAELDKERKMLWNLDLDFIHDEYLHPWANPDIPNPTNPCGQHERPFLLTLPPAELLRYLAKLHGAYRVTLNLTRLKIHDVLELLYDCEGMITHLEVFNLKDFINNTSSDIDQVLELQKAVNSKNVVYLKRVIREIIDRIKAKPQMMDPERLDKLAAILRNFGKLQNYYRQTPLKARVGSDSTGQTPRMPGMGMAVKESLPRSARRTINKTGGPLKKKLPVNISIYLRTTYFQPKNVPGWLNGLYQALRIIPGLNFIGRDIKEDWVVDKSALEKKEPGNIAALGGIRSDFQDSMESFQKNDDSAHVESSWNYLNSGLKNFLKITAGFIPAFFTFYLTKDWWLLAWFGAVIWFGITGGRNVIQSVLGGGGLKRSPVLRWKNFISWDRIADSLMYTGFSVPLLDYLVKTLLLAEGFNITTSNNPLALYAVMGLVNGLYISSHNLFRGLPRGAVVGNLFRSILAIPVAVAFNSLIGYLLTSAGVVGVDLVLQKWAAVISKAASDSVAGLIEGAADRKNNMEMRRWDYQTKLAQLFEAYSRLELFFPEKDMQEMMSDPKRFLKITQPEARDLVRLNIINALDLLYFWLYQPRARKMLNEILGTMQKEEKNIFIISQMVLQRYREISQMVIDGLVGKKFDKALAFYLNRYEDYLKIIQKM